MKTGIVVLTTAAGDKTKIVSEVIPYEQAVEKARAFQSGTEKAEGYDAVEIWSGAMRRLDLPAKAAKPAAAPAPPK